MYVCNKYVYKVFLSLAFYPCLNACKTNKLYLCIYVLQYMYVCMYVCMYVYPMSVRTHVHPSYFSAIDYLYVAVRIMIDACILFL